MWFKKVLIFTCFIFIFLNNSYSSESFFLMLKNSKVNVRYGPSFDYPIKFIYKKKFLPVEIIDNKENLDALLTTKKIVDGYIYLNYKK